MVELLLQEFKLFPKTSSFSFFPLKIELVLAEQLSLRCTSYKEVEVNFQKLTKLAFAFYVAMQLNFLRG